MPRKLKRNLVILNSGFRITSLVISIYETGAKRMLDKIMQTERSVRIFSFLDCLEVNCAGLSGPTLGLSSYVFPLCLMF